MDLLERIKNKEAKIAVIGLGYVGLPIAIEFARKSKVIGFDINQSRVDLMRDKIDPSEELPPEAFDGCDIHFTADIDDLKEANFFIVAVPTPIDHHKLPDLTPLLAASKTVGLCLKKGDYVVFESTVYPGCTEDDCIPVLEEHSGLKFKDDFKVGYSPERINPGDKEHTITKILKVVSGCDEESAAVISKVYELIVIAGVYAASTIKVAEAAKIIENTQRDVNIALMNELSVIFNRMGINTFEVLEAAGTKWNFLKFYPGLVGGHCIGVDPYYLTYKAKEFGYHAQIINSGRAINDSMGRYTAKQVVKKIIKTGTNINGSKVLVMGTTFKENVSDIRNTRVIDVITELQEYGVNVVAVDPYADAEDFKREYGVSLSGEDSLDDSYDAIVIAVNHKEYMDLNEGFFKERLNEKGFIFDIKGIYRNAISEIEYLSL